MEVCCWEMLLIEVIYCYYLWFVGMLLVYELWLEYVEGGDVLLLSVGVVVLGWFVEVDLYGVAVVFVEDVLFVGEGLYDL